MWDSSSRPSCAHAATNPRTWCGSSQPLPLASGAGWLLPAAALGLGSRVAPPGRRPWPWTWGGSSRPFLRCHSLALLATAPVLGRRVTPLGHCPSDMGSSRLLPLPRTWGRSSSRPALSAPVGYNLFKYFFDPPLLFWEPLYYPIDLMCYFLFLLFFHLSFCPLF